MARNKMPQGSGKNMFVGGGDSSGFTHVEGDLLKQVDVPVETLLGAANGAVTGGIASSIVSALVTLGKGAKEKGVAFKNITGSHLVPVLAGTAAFAALGGLVRNARARKHNEWSDKHYAFLAQDDAKSHAEKIEEKRNADAQDKGNAR